MQRQLAPQSHPPLLPRSPIGPLASGWPQVDVGFYVDCGMLPRSALRSAEPTSEPGDSRFGSSEGSPDNAEQQADVDVLIVLAADAAATSGGNGEPKTGAANPTTSCNGHRPAGSVEPLLFPGRPWRRQWGRAREQGSLKI
jgi:hypothetical protein